MNSLKSRTIRWNPQLICDCGFNKYILVILNIRIEFEKEFMISLWNKAHKKILVDGGANHWFEFLKKHNLSNADGHNIPDFITGDLDSVTQVVLNSFELLGTKIVRTPDQDETDFTKALRVLAEQSDDDMSEVEAVLTLAENYGRFDQIMANINTLYKAKEIFRAPVYLLSKECITWILWTGEHEIEIKLSENSGNKWCSLIPIGRRCNKVTTSGLKWNLDFGNTTTTLSSLTALGSLVALKAKIALAVAILWAAASFFAKWVGALALCRTGPSYDYSTPLYQDSSYGHSFSGHIGARPARTAPLHEPGSHLLKDFVELAKDRLAMTDLAIGAIDNGDCRRRLLCLANSYFSAQHMDYGDPQMSEENECELSCPPSALSTALTAFYSPK